MIFRYAYLALLRQRLRRFRADARQSRAIQRRELLQKIKRHGNSDFGRDHGFAEMKSVEDFRRRMPVLTYEDHQPYISRVLQGEMTALFAPGTRVLMFAMTSGTTGEPKRLPITEELFREYRAGWRMWAAGVYGDHCGCCSRKRCSSPATGSNIVRRAAFLADKSAGWPHRPGPGLPAACSCCRPPLGEFTTRRPSTTLRCDLPWRPIGSA